MRIVTIVLALAGAACAGEVHTLDPDGGLTPEGDCPRIQGAAFGHPLAFECQLTLPGGFVCPVIEAECDPASVDACVAEVERAPDCATLATALDGCHCD